MNIRYPIYEGVYRILTLVLPLPKMPFVFYPFVRFFSCLNRLGFTDALKGLANKLFPTLFPENYARPARKNFTGNALQSDGIKRGSPNLRLETQPETAGMGRISDDRKIIEKGG